MPATIGGWQGTQARVGQLLAALESVRINTVSVRLAPLSPFVHILLQNAWHLAPRCVPLPVCCFSTLRLR